MTYSIRPYRKGDRAQAESLLSGREECQELLALIRELPDVLYCAEQNGELVGLGGGWREGEPYARQLSLWVEPDARRMGIGSALVKACSGICHPATEYFCIHFPAEDEGCREFARALGFQPAYDMAVLWKEELTEEPVAETIVPYADGWFSETAALHNDAFSAQREALDLRPYRETDLARWRSELEDSRSLWLLLRDGHVAGMVSLDGEELGNLCVSERLRGRGLGRALVRFAEGLALGSGADYLVISVPTVNPAAEGLLPACGFEKAEVISYYRKRRNASAQEVHRA